MKGNRKIYLLAILLISIFGFETRAETVSQKQAQRLAQQFFNEAAGRVVAPVKLVYNGRRLTTDRLFAPFYVYNNPSGGFVIISAENKAFPILGFSLKENFDPDKLTDSEKVLLKSLAREIEYVRYDSDIPYQAIEAWGNYPGYVYDVLKAYYNATDPLRPIEEVYENLYLSLEDDQNPTFSDIYTPDQWSEMINDELNKNSNVELGIIENNEIIPVIVHGRKGDYYRLRISGHNDWLMRLNATELIPGNMMALFNNPIAIEENIIEETPYSLVDEFVAEVNEIESARTTTPHPDISLIFDEPVVRGLGGSHFEIFLPQNAVLATIYNLAGAAIHHQTYSNSNSVFVDLSPYPNGFYVVRIIGEDGTPYGLKLYK